MKPHYGSLFLAQLAFSLLLTGTSLYGLLGYRHSAGQALGEMSNALLVTVAARLKNSGNSISSVDGLVTTFLTMFLLLGILSSVNSIILLRSFTSHLKTSLDE